MAPSYINSEKKLDSDDDNAAIDGLSEFHTYPSKLGWLSPKPLPDITFVVRRQQQEPSKPTTGKL
jgi:hypothetical protein